MICVLAYETYNGAVEIKYQAHWNKAGNRTFWFHLRDKYSLHLTLDRNKNTLIVSKNDSSSINKDTWITSIALWGAFKK